MVVATASARQPEDTSSFFRVKWNGAIVSTVQQDLQIDLDLIPYSVEATQCHACVPFREGSGFNCEENGCMTPCGFDAPPFTCAGPRPS